MARSIFQRYGDDIDWYKVGDEVEAAGLDLREVDAELDRIRERASIKVQPLAIGDAEINDLTALPARGLRVVGNAYWVTGEERRRYSGERYVLVREPTHETDTNAIAVYCRKRKVGFIPAGTAKQYAPVLDGFYARGFLVGGTGVGTGNKMTVSLPTLPALRAHLKTASRAG